MSGNIANLIDHTLLKPDATTTEVNQLLEEALQYNFITVCVNPYWVGYCYEKLKESNVQVCTVVGFPLGANHTETKVFETKQALQDGATEIDMVINLGALKTQDDVKVSQDIAAVVSAAKDQAVVKVIIETALLTEEEKIRACQLSEQAGADFVKTSTGFSSDGATDKDIELMRQTISPDIGIKASGGIRSLVDLESMIDAGATRIGTSAGVAITKKNTEKM